jgi:hypothetical protein
MFTKKVHSVSSTLCFSIALLTFFSIGETTNGAIITTPGLLGVRFWEGTGGVVPFTFAPNSSEMTNQIGGALGPNNQDFAQIANENYDVFYSDANGTFNLNGNYVTVEAVYTNPGGGGGLNLAAVDLVFGSSILRADVLASWVGLGPNYAAGSEVLAVDADSPVPATLTTMGSTVPPVSHLRVTVTWSKLVPEPSSCLLMITSICGLAIRRR